MLDEASFDSPYLGLSLV